MATLDYVEIPVGSTRLRSGQNDKAQDIRPAPRISTSIPNPSPPTSPTIRRRRSSLFATNASSLNSPAMTFIPQMLLSAALPPSSSGPNSPTSPTMSTPKQKAGQESYTLLSTRDPLSLPIMSTNFKRFVSIIGPVFWIQDRIEEIVLWKRGTMRTLVWMAAYALICMFYTSFQPHRC